MTEKSNQGMKRPSLGGIGSRFDVGVAKMTCKHGETFLWRAAGCPITCGICHPPAPAVFEIVAGSGPTAAEILAKQADA